MYTKVDAHVVEALRRIRAALDPNHILDPGKIFP